jgi:rsbT antagonist protein RsbS
MDKIPILHMGEFLLVTIQVDFYDGLAESLETDLVSKVRKTGARGVLIDISTVSIVDSFMGRILGNIGMIAKVMDAETVLVGMQPAVAITLIDLGLPLSGLQCALNVDRGMEMLRSRMSNQQESTDVPDRHSKL